MSDPQMTGKEAEQEARDEQEPVLPEPEVDDAFKEADDVDALIDAEDAADELDIEDEDDEWDDDDDFDDDEEDDEDLSDDDLIADLNAD